MLVKGAPDFVNSPFSSAIDDSVVTRTTSFFSVVIHLICISSSLGTLTWSVYKNTEINRNNTDRLRDVDAQSCREHCQSLPRCGAIDYDPPRRLCFTNSVIGIKISWWRHQMEAYSTILAICAGNSLVTGKGQWSGALIIFLIISLIFAWMTGWINNHETGDLSRHWPHYDVTVMSWEKKCLVYCTKNEMNDYQIL